MTKRKNENSSERAAKPQRKSGRARPAIDYTAEKVEEHESDGKSSAKAKAPGGRRNSESVIIFDERKPIPSKNKDGSLVFEDHPEFTPNLTPKEVLQAGSFGGTYFRPIKSGVTGESYKDAWKEFPEDWFTGSDIRKEVASPSYDKGVNKYGVKCGGSLEMWEEHGWITEADPYGWFQWYCRFYLGRRSSDDERQIDRALRCFGPTGRWRIQLMNKIGRSTPKKRYDDVSISPVIRQVLQHWGYRLTEKDYETYVRKKGYAVV
ncbi:unnamed protein product [Phaeothamnion confervicola]